jgi:hypothetical protein
MVWSKRLVKVDQARVRNYVLEVSETSADIMRLITTNIYANVHLSIIVEEFVMPKDTKFSAKLMSKFYYYLRIWSGSSWGCDHVLCWQER